MGASSYLPCPSCGAAVSVGKICCASCRGCDKVWCPTDECEAAAELALVGRCEACEADYCEDCLDTLDDTDDGSLVCGDCGDGVVVVRDKPSAPSTADHGGDLGPRISYTAGIILHNLQVLNNRLAYVRKCLKAPTDE